MFECIKWLRRRIGMLAEEILKSCLSLVSWPTHQHAPPPMTPSHHPTPLEQPLMGTGEVAINMNNWHEAQVGAVIIVIQEEGDDEMGFVETPQAPHNTPVDTVIVIDTEEITQVTEEGTAPAPTQPHAPLLLILPPPYATEEEPTPTKDVVPDPTTTTASDGDLEEAVDPPQTVTVPAAPNVIEDFFQAPENPGAAIRFTQGVPDPDPVPHTALNDWEPTTPPTTEDVAAAALTELTGTGSGWGFSFWGKTAS